MHDWGSALALHYARLHPERVRVLATMEAIIVPTMPAKSYEALPRRAAGFSRKVRGPVSGRRATTEENYFIERPLSQALVSPTPDSRRFPATWPEMMPIGGEPAVVREVVSVLQALAGRTHRYPVASTLRPARALNPLAVADYWAQRARTSSSPISAWGVTSSRRTSPTSSDAPSPTGPTRSISRSSTAVRSGKCLRDLVRGKNAWLYRRVGRLSPTKLVLLLVLASCRHGIGYDSESIRRYRNVLAEDVTVGPFGLSPEARESLVGVDKRSCVGLTRYEKDLQAQLQQQFATHLHRTGLFGSVNVGQRDAPLQLSGRISRLSVCVYNPSDDPEAYIGAAMGGIVSAVVAGANAKTYEETGLGVRALVQLTDLRLVERSSGDLLWEGGVKYAVSERLDGTYEGKNAFAVANLVLRDTFDRVALQMRRELARSPKYIPAPAGLYRHEGLSSACIECPETPWVAFVGPTQSLEEARELRDSLDRSHFGPGYPFIATALDVGIGAEEEYVVVTGMFDRRDRATRWMRAARPTTPSMRLGEAPVRRPPPPRSVRIVELDTDRDLEARTSTASSVLGTVSGTSTSSSAVACVVPKSAVFAIEAATVERTPLEWAPVYCEGQIAFVPRMYTRLGASVQGKGTDSVLGQAIRRTHGRIEIARWRYEGARRQERLRPIFIVEDISLINMSPHTSPDTETGRDMAIQMSKALQEGRATREAILRFALGLPTSELVKFVEVWAQKVDPVGPALEIYSELQAAARKRSDY